MTRFFFLICLSILLIECGKSTKQDCAISPYESELLLNIFFDTGDSTKLDQLIESTDNILENKIVVNRLFINRLAALTQKGDIDTAISELNKFMNSSRYSEKYDIGYADLINILRARKSYMANDSVKAQSYLRKNVERYHKKINWTDFTNQLGNLNEDDTNLPFNEDEMNFLKYLVMVSIMDSEAVDVEINKILKQCPNARTRSIEWENYLFFFNPFVNFIYTREELENKVYVEEIIAEPTDTANE